MQYQCRCERNPRKHNTTDVQAGSILVAKPRAQEMFCFGLDVCISPGLLREHSRTHSVQASSGDLQSLTQEVTAYHAGFSRNTTGPGTAWSCSSPLLPAYSPSRALPWLPRSICRSGHTVRLAEGLKSKLHSLAFASRPQRRWSCDTS